ncbi:MAG: RES domain-containing protein [Alphaproteobacteria bacterium]|nr:RES domain-containing protein [Alphaproteobacteria bacterium]
MPKASHGRRVNGVFWRMLSPRWHDQPLSGEGAARHGGRFNRPDVGALYFSARVETALAEYGQDLPNRPGTVVAYSVRVAGIVDLGDPISLRALGATATEVTANWKPDAFLHRRDPITWRIADRARARGATGLLYPSTRYQGGVNLVIWLPTRGRIDYFDPNDELAGRKR